jgi:hypothetical protein
MILTDCACTDHAEFQCHFHVPFLLLDVPVNGSRALNDKSDQY